MGTRGFLAYRHKGKYYRVYLLNDAHPSQYVRCCMNLIPRDPARLEEWIENTGKALENERQRIRILTAEYPLEHDEASAGATTNSPANDGFGSDDDDAQKHIWILSDSDRSWTLGATFIEWTYVFDLDDRVFTVNGTVHFRLDNMPPQQISPTGFISMQYLMSYKRVEIPDEYLKTVDSWPPPRFDTERAELEYNQLQPLIVPLSEWGVPNWEVLTVPQKLASSLVKTLIEDYTDELALAHYPSVWHKVGLFCWQVVNTAAPSHLICPPLNSTLKTSSLYVRADLTKRAASMDQSIHNHVGGKGTLGRYCWFRGCLVTFCPRLDEAVYIAYQVEQMVGNLRKHGRTSGIGIVMSGWHVVAVTVDGPDVRHSTALNLHDGKELGDGVLMLMHLLSPTLTTEKTPWNAQSLNPQPAATTLPLPEDVLQQIIHYTDWDTYITLPSVSRYFRSIYLAYPRVGDSILLGYETDANSELVFRVRDNNSSYPILSYLLRIRSSVDNRLPIWRYNSKCYLSCVLRPGLVGTFQHVQTGTGPFDSATREEESDVFGYKERRVLFADVVRGDKYPEMRIQAIDGVWEMVGIDQDRDSKVVRPTRETYLTQDWGERMTGFDSEDVRELSEVEGGWYLSDSD